MHVHAAGGVQADIEQIMEKIRKFSDRQQTAGAAESEVAAAKPFGEVLSMAGNLVDKTSHLDTVSENLNAAWLTGDRNVSISQVVVAAEKSRLAMEGLVTVRNKILDAYREIMSMQI